MREMLSPLKAKLEVLRSTILGLDSHIRENVGNTTYTSALFDGLFNSINVLTEGVDDKISNSLLQLQTANAESFANIMSQVAKVEEELDSKFSHILSLMDELLTSLNTIEIDGKSSALRGKREEEGEEEQDEKFFSSYEWEWVMIGFVIFIAIVLSIMLCTSLVICCIETCCKKKKKKSNENKSEARIENLENAVLELSALHTKPPEDVARSVLVGSEGGEGSASGSEKVANFAGKAVYIQDSKA